MHDSVKHWIANAIRKGLPTLELAVRQRAKFEGWLKIELAHQARLAGCEDVTLESSDENARADVSFALAGRRYRVELKTANSNWRIPGVVSKGRPITKNIAGIVGDARKLAACNGIGIVGFVLFPVPTGDSRWLQYLNRIAADLSISLDAAIHTSRVVMDLPPLGSAELVIGAFTVPSSRRTDVPMRVNSLRRQD